MIPEAAMSRTENGLVPEGEGWYVMNLADAAWRRNEKFGTFCNFEGSARFTELGINVHVLQPGQPACHYHEENAQEDFLVLSGECLLLVEGVERRLRAWDFVHCPPWTRHVFVGAGTGPCAVLMTGVRKGADEKLFYPRDPLAVKHDAASPEETEDARVSYAGIAPSSPVPSIWPLEARERP